MLTIKASTLKSKINSGGKFPSMRIELILLWYLPDWLNLSVLVGGYLTSLLLVHQMTFLTMMIQLKLLKHEYIKELKVSDLHANAILAHSGRHQSKTRDLWFNPWKYFFWLKYFAIMCVSHHCKHRQLCVINNFLSYIVKTSYLFSHIACL